MKTDPPIHCPAWSIADLTPLLTKMGIGIVTNTNGCIQSSGLGQPLLGPLSCSPIIASTKDICLSAPSVGLPPLWWVKQQEALCSRPCLYPLPNLVKDWKQQLFQLLAPRFVLHGTLVKVFDTGVLLTGKSNIGKTTLAMALVARGHQLVCDDAPYFSVKHGRVVGWCSPSIKNLYHLRSQGTKNVIADFGHSAVADFAVLDLEIELCDKPQRLTKESDISSLASAKLYSSTFYKKVILPVESQNNLIILVEYMVRMAQKNQSTGCG